MKIAINGFGRIGRTFLRMACEKPASPAGGPEIEIVAINDLGDLDNLAYLLKYDSVYRKFDKEVKAEKGEQNYLIIGSPATAFGVKKIKFFSEKDPAKLPWKDLDIDVAVESTGIFESYEKASAHLTAGAKRAVITAPAKGEGGEGKTILLGVNENEFNTCQITSNGSCTTNAVHPVAQIMSENPGVKKAVLNTIHAYTATQKIVDGSDAKDWRKGRAGAVNIVPSTTGAAISVTEAVQGLKGLFDGISLRVPILSGSVADFTFVSARETSVSEINKILKEAEQSPRWKGILKTVEEPIVSSDIIGEPFGAIVDLSFTKVVGGDLVKILSWYDNEWGYSAILVEHVIKAGLSIKG